MHDFSERVSTIVAFQVFHIFQKKNARPVMIDDLRQIEEKRSLCNVGKAVGSTKGIFLRDTCYREGLAGKTRQKNVMCRDSGKGFAVFRELPDITGKNMLAILAEILPIGFGGKFVLLAGEHAFAAYVFEADPQPAYACEKVDETETCVFHGLLVGLRHHLKYVDDKLCWRTLTRLISLG